MILVYCKVIFKLLCQSIRFSLLVKSRSKSAAISGVQPLSQVVKEWVIVLYPCIGRVFLNDFGVDRCQFLCLGGTNSIISERYVLYCEHPPESDCLLKAERVTIPEESIDGLLHSPHIREIWRRCCAVVRLAEVLDHFQVLYCALVSIALNLSGSRLAFFVVIGDRPE